MRAAAARRPASELVLGIRPEHLHLAGRAPGELAGEVLLVEELGADALLHVRLAEAGTRWWPAPRAASLPRRAQRVTFRVQPADVFAFHPVTGARLAG